MQGFHCVRGKDNIYTSHILSSELNNQHVSEKNRWVEGQDTVILQKKKKVTFDSSKFFLKLFIILLII